MKKVLALLMALCMLLALCACTGGAAPKEEKAPAEAAETAPEEPAEEAPAEEEKADEGESFDVVLQMTVPEQSAGGMMKVLDAITEESGGRLNFEVYYSFSFVENADVIDALQTNQLDIAGFLPNENVSLFPLSGNLVTMPLLNYPSLEAANRIYLNLLYNNEDMMAEFTDNDLLFWGGYMMPGYQYFSTEEIEGHDPSVLSGKTIMCDSAVMQQFINANSGAAISVFPTEYVSNLQNGVAESLIQHANCGFAFGAFDYVKGALFFGDAGFYNLPVVYAISPSFWEKLPADLQDIFAAHAAELCFSLYAEDAGMLENVSLPTLKAATEPYVMNDEEIAVWQDAIKPIVDSTVEEMTSANPGTQTVYETLTDLIANYDADSFVIGTNNFGLEASWGN